jgi:ABC-type phosphate/phosphonate transport system permease subunit
MGVTCDRDATRYKMMGYYPQRRRRSQLAGIIILLAFLVVTGMFILIGFTALGAIFSQFNGMTGMLNTRALSVYNFLRSTVVNVFSLMSIMVMLATVGAVITAIFALNRGGSNEG